MNGNAVREAEEQRMVEEEYHLSANRVVDEGGGQGDDEMKEKSRGCGLLSSWKTEGSNARLAIICKILSNVRASRRNPLSFNPG